MKIAISREFWYATLLLLSCAAVASYFLTTSTTKVADAAAGPPFALSGYAWASTDFWDGISLPPPPVETGVGWISMNCSDGGPGKTNVCASSNYGVQIDSAPTKTTAAYLSGYAWAGGNVDTAIPPNKFPFGFINFNDNGCPAGNLDTDGNCAPRIISDGANGWEMTGWARACSVLTDCTDPLTLKSNTERGGWDGWISLNCENTGTCSGVDYAVRINADGSIPSATNQAGSFAWGDSVVGWMNFSQVVINDLNIPPPPTYACLPLPPPSEVSEETTQDIWGNSEMNQTDCTATGKVCDRVVGSPTTGQCISNTAPTINNFDVTPRIVRKGGQVTVSWTVSNPATCVLKVSGQSDITPLQPSGSIQVIINLNLTTITLDCGGGVSQTKTVQTLPTIYE